MAIGTTIDGLNAVTSLTANDKVPVWDAEASGEPTKKITAQNMAASVKSLASLPNTTEMNTAIAQSTAKIGVITNDEKGQSVSVATGTFVTIASISLSAGKYIVTGDIAFDSTSSTGIRILILAPTETNTNDYTNSVLASGRADLTKTRIVEFNTTTTMYLRAYHTIGSSTGVKGRVRAISIA